MSSTTAAGLPIDQLITKPATSAPATSNLNNQLGEDAFLKLLTAQLANQDPLNPVDQTQSIAQLAQFSSLQATTQLKDSFTAFQSNFSVMQSAGLIGKTVSASTADAAGNSSSVQGIVKTVSIVNGQPEFTLVDAKGNFVTDAQGQPLEIPTANILSIG